MGETVSSLVKSGPKSRDADTQDDGLAQWHYEYSTVIGYFLQDSLKTDPGTFDAMKGNFGLIEQEYDTDRLLPANGKDLTQWQRFAFTLKMLNERAPADTSYRLLYLGRHGQGYHNVGQSFYGDDAWDCYYSTLERDPHVPGIEFFDAHLTLLGKHQATTASQFWSRLIETQHIPVAQSYYSSPHTRAIQTAQLTFEPLSLPTTAPFAPTIKELLREGYGIHTCDSRPTRTYLEHNFPRFKIEPGLTETDQLYSAVYREPPRVHTSRMTRLLDDVFQHDDNTYISMTSHSGTIAATLRAVEHRAFMLPTGGVIPVLVKVKQVPGPRPDDGSSQEKWETKPDCQGDPNKAGLPGYKDIGEYLEEIERNVPIVSRSGDEARNGNDLEVSTSRAKGVERENA